MGRFCNVGDTRRPFAQGQGNDATSLSLREAFYLFDIMRLFVEYNYVLVNVQRNKIEWDDLTSAPLFSILGRLNCSECRHREYLGPREDDFVERKSFASFVLMHAVLMLSSSTSQRQSKTELALMALLICRK